MPRQGCSPVLQRYRTNLKAQLREKIWIFGTKHLRTKSGSEALRLESPAQRVGSYLRTTVRGSLPGISSLNLRSPNTGLQKQSLQFHCMIGQERSMRWDRSSARGYVQLFVVGAESAEGPSSARGSGIGLVNRDNVLYHVGYETCPGQCHRQNSENALTTPTFAPTSPEERYLHLTSKFKVMHSNPVGSLE